MRRKCSCTSAFATAGDGLRCVWLDFLGVFAFIKSQKPIKGSVFVLVAFRKAVFS
jgi:hypothetical protein